MTPARKKRLGLILLMLIGIGIGVSFALKSLNENIMFFFTPAEVAAGEAPEDRLFRCSVRPLDRFLLNGNSGNFEGEWRVWSLRDWIDHDLWIRIPLCGTQQSC